MSERVCWGEYASGSPEEWLAATGHGPEVARLARCCSLGMRRRVPEDRRDCYWLYVATDCPSHPRLHEVRDPAQVPWHEVTRVDHYWLEVDTLTPPVVSRGWIPIPLAVVCTQNRARSSLEGLVWEERLVTNVRSK